MHVLPAEHHDRDWDAIVVPREVKERLLAQALLVLQHGRKLSMLSGLPHGLIVLAGPPGTGKTTMARGLAQVAALALAREGATTLLEINPHAFPSDMLGESQRNVTRLLAETIPEIAARRPFTVVLIDEVESFAVSRSAASFEANPVDVHRATDAVLLGVDEIAKKLPSVLFVTTTNFHRGRRHRFPVARGPGDALCPPGSRHHREDPRARDRRARGAVAAAPADGGRPRPHRRARRHVRGLGRAPHPQARARGARPAAGGGARSREARLGGLPRGGAQARRGRMVRRDGAHLARDVPRRAEGADA
jgi:SpoVK/Ycf46/Vps4 family AAA+-type ATPase